MSVTLTNCLDRLQPWTTKNPGRFPMRLVALALVLAAVPSVAQGPPADLVVRHATIVDVTNGQT
jgi:hypothetical protein